VLRRQLDRQPVDGVTIVFAAKEWSALDGVGKRFVAKPVARRPPGWRTNAIVRDIPRE
jgi:hypothetical protein